MTSPQLTSVSGNWRRENLQILLAEIDRIRQMLLMATEESDRSHTPLSVTSQNNSSWLDQLCTTFGLVPFERDIVLLCAGLELDPQFGNLCAQIQGVPNRTYPTLGIAIAHLPEVDLRVFSDQAPLQRWRLIDMGQGYAQAQQPLRLSPRIFCYLMGQPACAPELEAFWRPLSSDRSGATLLAASHQAIATQLTHLWQPGTIPQQFPLIQLHGTDALVNRSIALQACEQWGWNLAELSLAGLLRAAHPHHLLQQLCWREALLTNSVLLINCHDLGAHRPGWLEALHAFTAELEIPLIISTPERLTQHHRPLITLEVSNPTHAEQRHLWQTHLGDAAADLNGHLDILVSQFNLSAPAIATACLTLQTNPGPLSLAPSTLPYPLPQLWNFCRVQARHGLDALAQRIETKATWEDLILPEDHKTTLQTLAVHLRQRTQVYQTWGFEARSSRGLGISALFSGQSGTGKTMAAEVVARELHLDLYRIDLSAVVSKYIGETEKNLQRIFDAAEVGGAILLFDEADALFGKRTEVKDSHDRHANVEVSYLLQRMEAYRGLAILTTNLKKSIDQAFLRRIQFMLAFPFPDAKSREEIWRRIFPPQTPIQDLKYDKLASLNVSGGNIRNIALNAAFLAAEAGDPVTMEHILEAAKREYTKLERTLTKVETSGWIDTKKAKE